jgi:hypothetical protein
MSTEEQAYLNTDRELFREVPEGEPMSYYSPSVMVTADNQIGMNVGGRVIVARIEEWHAAMSSARCIDWDSLRPVE